MNNISDDVIVFDDLVPMEIIEEIEFQLMGSLWSGTEIASAGNVEFRHLASELQIEMPLIHRLFLSFRAKITDIHNYKLIRVYANGHTIGDVPLPHCDSESPNDLTVLYYANKAWDWAYGGETVFFDSNKNTVNAVMPRPGRIVFFKASLFHCARIQNRYAPFYRYTIAFKFVKCR
jgi:Rps23 Pro-64 3,4-dihydroxylase Tpa1-like proline 4-hydroxylase